MAAAGVGWQVLVGDAITASIGDPPGGLYGHVLGARIEAPYTRAIVSAYQLATLSNGTWTVALEGLLAEGAYQFVWRTNDAEPPYYEVFLPLQAVTSMDGAGTSTDPFPVIDRDAVCPTPDDVAPLERSRIVSEGGGDPGTFTEDTNPTAAEVDTLIDQALDDTLNLLPYRVATYHYESIERAVVLYAATLVEASYFREQMDERSVALYRNMFNEQVAAINARVAEDYRTAAVATQASTGGAILA